MPLTASQKYEARLEKIRRRFDLSYLAFKDWRDDAESSLQFLTGNQWPEDNANMRKKDGRPVLTVNRLGQLVRLVSNEISKSQPTMDIHPVDSLADLRTAEAILGIVRHIERVADSSVAYGVATDNQVRTGIGYFGFGTRYANRRSFDQEIYLRPFLNPLAVYRDPSSVAFDGSDANYYFVVEKMSKDQYREKWPNSELVADGFPVQRQSIQQHWLTDEEVQVAEYWYIEKTQAKLIQLDNGNVGLEKDFRDQYSADDLRTMTKRSRMVTDHVVKRCMTNGYEILQEDIWPGAWIPIIPVLGEVIYVDGKAKFRGLVEDAKEPQRVLNYSFSGAMEAIALSPLQSWVAAVGQTEPFEGDWALANKKPMPVLKYEPQVVTTEGDQVVVPPPQRPSYDPNIQAHLIAVQLAEDGIRHAVGLHSPSLGKISKERSGRAIERLQHQGSLATFHYVLNFARSLRFGIKQLVGDGERPGLIQKIYYEPGRILRILGDDEKNQTFVIGTKETDAPANIREDKTFAGVYDPSVGLYDVVADIGQAFATQRQDAFHSIGQIFQSAPELFRYYADLWFKHADFPGARELQKRARNMLPPEATGDKPQIPPEVEQKFQEMTEQLKEAMEENEKLSRTVESKEIESESRAQQNRDTLASKERIEALKAHVEIVGMIWDAAIKGEELDMKEAMEKMRASTSVIEKFIDASKKAAESAKGGSSKGD